MPPETKSVDSFRWDGFSPDNLNALAIGQTTRNQGARWFKSGPLQQRLSEPGPLRRCCNCRQNDEIVLTIETLLASHA